MTIEFKYIVTADLPAELYTDQHVATKRAARAVAAQLRADYPVKGCEVRISDADGDTLEAWTHDGRAWVKS